MNYLKTKAPAKINLHLKIVGIREDGYHLLQMLMVPINLYDEITIEETKGGIEIASDDPHLPVDETNIVWKATAAIQNGYKIDKGVRIYIKKRIPMGGGMGGGSSDAGAVLKILNLLWNLNLNPQKLMKIGAGLGADVPFFCQDKPAICEGIGELITPVQMDIKLHLILINPGIHVSTPWAYREWDVSAQSRATTGKKRDFVLTEKCKGVRLPRIFGHVDDVIKIMSNDLELPIIEKYPEIGEIKSALVDAGAIKSMMTGSGSTVFGVFCDEVSRDGALGRLRCDSWRVFSAVSL